MLFFSTLFQQAVETRLKLIEDIALQSTISRSIHYISSNIKDTLYNNDNLYTSDMSGMFYLSLTRYPNQLMYPIGVDINITNAINTAMLANSPDLSDVRAFCPTGQCSWDPYTTLGVCTSTEDISAQLIYQKDNDTSPFKRNIVTLPGVTVSPYPTFWTTTVFGFGNGTIGQGGQLAERNAFDLKNPDSNLDDLAQIYLAYQDPCLRKGEADHENKLESWRAFKGKVRLCLQTLKTDFNTSTNTTVIQSRTDLTWNGTENFIFLDWNKGPLASWKTRLSNNQEEFSMGMVASLFIGGQIAKTFNMSGIFVPEGDNYVYGNLLVPDFVTDIYGPEPLVCLNSTEIGFKGFTRRLGNIAIGLTNA